MTLLENHRDILRRAACYDRYPRGAVHVIGDGVRPVAQKRTRQRNRADQRPRPSGIVVNRYDPASYWLIDDDPP